MRKESVKYTDYDGLEREETLYFDINEAEFMQMQLEYPGGLDKYLDRIYKMKDMVECSRFFLRILLASYGEKSEDGRHFRKSKQIADDFRCSKPFDIMYTRLVSDEDYATKFLQDIIPDRVKDKVADANKQFIAKK